MTPIPPIEPLQFGPSDMRYAYYRWWMMEEMQRAIRQYYCQMVPSAEADQEKEQAKK